MRVVPVRCPDAGSAAVSCHRFERLGRPWSEPVSEMATDSLYIYTESGAVRDGRYAKQGVFS